MAGSINKVTLIGNLGADPEVRFSQDGRKIANLRIATSESWKDKQTGEKRERTEWHRVVCFSQGLSEVMEKYLRKGAKVYIEGSLRTRKWQDQSGQDRYSTEVVLDGFNGQMVMLDSRGGGGGGYDSDQSPPAESDYGSPDGGSGGGGPVGDDLDDEIPF